jgi:hypothetical protein
MKKVKASSKIIFVLELAVKYSIEILKKIECFYNLIGLIINTDSYNNLFVMFWFCVNKINYWTVEITDTY